MPTNTEWLARRTTNYYVRRWKFGLDRKELFDATSVQIGVVGSDAVRIGLESQGIEPGSFESESQAPTPCKQIKHTLRTSDIWSQDAVDHFGVWLGFL
jgi:hypothetical protein